MRFRHLARRITLAPTLALALALAVAACSSGSSSSSATPSSSSAPAASSAAPSSPAASSAAPSSPSAAGGNAKAQITANWEKFFSSSTPISQKVSLLQNGSTFESAIKDFANFPLASSIGAKVTKVTVNSATSATVTYDITASGGSSLLPNQKGTAVYQDGRWKVGDASLCGLLNLVPGSSAPAACNSVG